MKRWLPLGLLWATAWPGRAAPGLPPPPDSLRALLRAAPAEAPARAAVLLRVARAYAQATAAQARRLADPLAEGRALAALGRYYSNVHDDRAALPLLRRAEPLLAGAPPAERARFLTHPADAYAALRRPAPARAGYGRAFAWAARAPAAVRGALQAEVLNSLGVLALESEQYDSAA